MKEYNVIFVLIFVFMFSLAFVSAQTSLKAYQLQDCTIGVIQCGWSDTGTSAIKECVDGSGFVIKQDCGNYGTCSIDSQGNPFCTTDDSKINSIESNNNQNNTLIIGGAIIIGFIILAIILSRRNKK